MYQHLRSHLGARGPRGVRVEATPGDSVVDDITVTNSGSLEARYAVSSTTTENTLAAQLHLTIWDEA